MPKGTTYGGREDGFAEAVADQFIARGIGVGGGGGGTVGGSTAVKQDEQTSELQAIKNRLPLNGALSEGTDGAGTSIPNGGTGARGWLSAIWKSITDRLPNIENSAQNILNRLMPPGTVTSYIGTSAGDVLKATNGNIYAITCSNNNSSNRYFQVFDKASAPAANDVPVRSFPVYASDGLLLIGQDIIGGNGIILTTGVAWGISTSRLAYNPATANETIVTVRWG